MKKKYLESLYNFLNLNFRSKKITASILEDLLTPQELKSIAERLQIIKALTQGKTHREIAQELGISIGKITRGSKVLQYGNIDWSKMLKRKF